MTLHSRVCDILGIDYPIVLAGMGGASGPELAAAVSNAGGLGVLGAAACGPKQLREWIQRTRALTDKPFWRRHAAARFGASRSGSWRFGSEPG